MGAPAARARREVADRQRAGGGAPRAAKKEDVWQSDDDAEARVGALGDAWSICGST
jgi:hypothetical protein